MAYLVDSDGKYLVDLNGAYLVDDGGTITEWEGSATGSFSVAENTTAVGVIDYLGDSASITGGADAALFSGVDGGSGAGLTVAFLAAPDYESPADADADNVYEIEVTATNALGSDVYTVYVTVTDEAEGGGGSTFLRGAVRGSVRPWVIGPLT